MFEQQPFWNPPKDYKVLTEEDRLRLDKIGFNCKGGSHEWDFNLPDFDRLPNSRKPASANTGLKSKCKRCQKIGYVWVWYRKRRTEEFADIFAVTVIE